jgi:DNA-binding GntR family transcriptional regulator
MKPAGSAHGGENDGEDVLGTREDGARPGTKESPEDKVYRALFEGILDHRLPPGTKLKEVPLAEAFGVTRGVIRKVLGRLSTAKVVHLRSQHGATVAAPSLEEVAEIFAARRLVESFVAERLSGSMSARQIKEIRALIQQERKAYQAGDVKTGIKLSAEFHIRLADYAGNKLLTEFLRQLVYQTPLIFLTHGEPGKNVSCSEHEHLDILSALVEGDRELAVARTAAHLNHLESHVVPHVEKPSSDLARMLGLG